MKQHLKDCPICCERPDIFQNDEDTAQDAIEAWNKQTVEDIENEFQELKKPWKNFGDFQDWKI